MAFDKEEQQHLENLFVSLRAELATKSELALKLDEQRAAIALDARSLLYQELQPIKDDLTYVKQRLDALFEMESEDVQMNYREIEKLKTYVKRLEQRIAALEH